MNLKITQYDPIGSPRDAVGWAHAPGWIVANALDAARLGPGPCVLSPITAGLGPELADIAAALPIGDANAALMQSLGALAEATTGAHPDGGGGAAHIIAGMFGNDPFRPRDDVFAAIAASPVAAVANWPSVGLLSGELAEQLSSAGYLFDKEMAMLTAAQASGLKAVAFVCTEDHAEAARALGAAMIVVAPPLAINTDGERASAGAAARRVLERLGQGRGGAEVRLYRHSAHGMHLADAAQQADGIIGFAADR